MLILFPLAAIAASSFALGYGVRALISARRKERSWRVMCNVAALLNDVYANECGFI
jgi:hypothetical protein